MCNSWGRRLTFWEEWATYIFYNNINYTVVKSEIQ